MRLSVIKKFIKEALKTQLKCNNFSGFLDHKLVNNYNYKAFLCVDTSLH